MSTAASAVTTVDSATTEATPTPVVPAFNATDQKTWSPAQRDHWNKTGAQPSKADSATAKPEKDTTQTDSSTAKETTADSASDSATDKAQKPNIKTKEDTERRFKEILEENKALQRRLESLERGKGSDTRDSKQASQPAAETYQPIEEEQYFKDNPKSTYQDFVRAAAKHEAKWEVRQEMAAERQRIATETAKRELSARVDEAKKRYPDFETRIQPAAEAIETNQRIPLPVKAMLSGSPVFTDLLYVIAEPKALADFIETATNDPASAIRKLVLTEQLIMAELAKANGQDKAGEDKGGTARDASGKFVSSQAKDESKDDEASETKVRAPHPITEAGGRGTAAADPRMTAAKAGNFRQFEAEENRRQRAGAKA